jgi:hypothetical protein
LEIGTSWTRVWTVEVGKGRVVNVSGDVALCTIESSDREIRVTPSASLSGKMWMSVLKRAARIVRGRAVCLRVALSVRCLKHQEEVRWRHPFRASVGKERLETCELPGSLDCSFVESG